MKLKLTHISHVANKIALDIANSNLLELKAPIENIANTARVILEEDIKKEAEIDEKAKSLLEENLDEIEFMRADERQLFWMIKRQIAEQENFLLSWEDRYSDISHRILDEISLEGFIKFSISENLIKNIIFKSIDSYSKIYEEIEDEVIEKIKHYKRKILVGTDEYELVFEKLYEEELKRKGFL
ncbi:DUF507 family protein [Helicobacter cappadocius]|uniref:DUF507 family protein n=1 Tax=Helicobacter cappadocius TaxID=3063998 RepID=A0AA90PJS6_9HELI|nr:MULTISPECIES: DUF507 family protein [unclassified Helicobacter]MDO7253349.1 DUF507 family protein [Helicobacter sp. faydin-H75]MDP2539221.1 DUF507 family protein [Helicobacter sp. faydin-H76]